MRVLNIGITTPFLSGLRCALGGPLGAQQGSILPFVFDILIPLNTNLQTEG